MNPWAQLCAWYVMCLCKLTRAVNMEQYDSPRYYIKSCMYCGVLVICLNTVDPLIKDTPEMRTPPLINEDTVYGPSHIKCIYSVDACVQNFP